MEQLQKASSEGNVESLLFPVGKAFESLPALLLDSFRTRLFLNGVPLDLKKLRCPKTEGDVRVMGSDKTFLGVARPDWERGILITTKILAARQPAPILTKG